MIVKKFENSIITDENQSEVTELLERYRSFIINGEAGSGKTYRFIMPSLDKAIKENRSIILTGRDLRYKKGDSGDGENTPRISEAILKLRAADYKIFYFNMSNPHTLSPFISGIRHNFNKRETDLIRDILIDTNRYLMSSEISKLDTWIFNKLISGDMTEILSRETSREAVDVHEILNDKVAFVISYDMTRDNVQTIFATHLLVALYSVIINYKLDGGKLNNAILIDDSKFTYAFLKVLDYDKFSLFEDLILVVSSQLWIVENSLPTINIGNPTTNRVVKL